MRRLIVVLTIAVLCAPAQAALVVDSFTDGPFSFSHDASAHASQQQFGSMLGGERVVSISTDRRRTTVTASVTPGSSALTFDTGSGSVGGLDEQGELILLYGGETGPYRPFDSHPLNLNLSGFSTVEVDISALRGSGRASLVLYSGPSYSVSPPVTLQSIGTLQFSLSALGRPLADVDSVSLEFVGMTKDFAISIDEVRIVPEPTAAVLLSMAMLIVATERIRRRDRG